MSNFNQPPGIMNVKFAFGHDEYAYLAFRHNNVAIPEEGYAMLRLHSCYPWHRGGAYRALMAPGDDALLEAVKRGGGGCRRGKGCRSKEDVE
jgi:inositol oxygenase